MAEEVGIEGRWGYFDKAGQMRDMIQNHLLQILCMIAMSPPSDLSADSIRDEKVKVLKSLRRIDRSNVREKNRTRAIYCGLRSGQKKCRAIWKKRARTRAAIQKPSWRSASTLITGAGPVCHSTCVLVKRLPTKCSEVVVYFKTPELNLFKESWQDLPQNKLTIRLQPDEGVDIRY